MFFVIKKRTYCGTLFFLFYNYDIAAINLRYLHQ